MSFFCCKMKKRRKQNEKNQRDRTGQNGKKECQITEKERRGEHFMQEVNWDAVNLLELGMLLDMAKDGYEFQIADGRIKSIEVKLLS